MAWTRKSERELQRVEMLTAILAGRHSGNSVSGA
jgi:hypothetical protein